MCNYNYTYIYNYNYNNALLLLRRVTLSRQMALKMHFEMILGRKCTLNWKKYFFSNSKMNRFAKKIVFIKKEGL